MRPISIFFFLDTAEWCLLRSKNSSTMIRKIKKQANLWNRITALCFWDADCNQKNSLRFVISLHLIAVVTAPTTFIAALLAHIDMRFFNFAGEVFLANVFFEMFLDIVVGTYAMILNRKHDRKK